MECVRGWLGSASLNVEEGLPAKGYTDYSDGFESEDTSAGSTTSCESSQCLSAIHDSAELSTIEDVITSSSSPKGLVLAEVSQLRASSPSFVPEFLLSEAALPIPETSEVSLPVADSCEQTTSRTKLSSKAGLFVPAPRIVHALPTRPLPFVPMANVIDAWQQWSEKRIGESSSDLPFVPMATVIDAWQQWS